MLLVHRVEPESFGAQMAGLHALGFHAIPLDLYVRFMRGERVRLPSRPVLLTFDDAYVSALVDADPVLARYGWSAALYVPTGAVGRPGHLTWAQLEQMQASGRWQIDEHAGNGHHLVQTNAAGRRAPFYADELWTNRGRESFAHYRRRVGGDIELGARLLAAHLRRATETFAVPFGNYGQWGTNDPRIEPWLSRFLARRFAVVFVQGDTFTTPGQRFADRIAVPSRWTAQTLESRLRRGLDALTMRTRG